MGFVPSPSYWHRRRVFVTGCTGFLGPWLVRELIAAGAEVVGLVRDRVPPSELFRDGTHHRMTVVRGRVEDQGRLETAFALYDVRTVFHLAAPSRGPAHQAAAWALTVLSAADRAGTSADVILPVERDDPTGRVEAAARFAAWTAHPVGLAVLPRVFGGGDRNWSRLVPRLARAVVAGDPLPTASADELAEPYLYAREAARGLMSLAEAVGRGGPARSEPRPTAVGRNLVTAFRDHPAAEPTPLAAAVAETIGWYRQRTGTANRLSPVRSAA